MGSTLLLCLAAVTGIDTGWQPLDSGGVQYLVQISPDAVEQLRQQGYTAQIPPEAQDVRRFLIFMGSGKLPRVGDSSRTRPIATGEGFRIDIPEEHVKNLREGVPINVNHRNGVQEFSIFVGDKPAPEPDQSTRGNPFAKGAGSPAAVDEPAAKDLGPGLKASDREPDPFRFPSFSAPRADGAGFGAQRPPSGTGTAPSLSPRTPAGQWPPYPSAATGAIGREDEKMATFPSTSTSTSKRPTAPEIDPAPAESAASPSDNVKPGANEESGAAKASEEPSKPWAPLIVVLLTLFGSLGANIYLSWLNWDSRARYKALLTEVHGQTPAA